MSNDSVPTSKMENFLEFEASEDKRIKSAPRHIRVGGGGGPRNEDVAVLGRICGCVQCEAHHRGEHTGGKKNARGDFSLSVSSVSQLYFLRRT
jgi:hypothetical protein